MDFDSYLQSKGYAPGTRIPAAAARQLHAQFLKDSSGSEFQPTAIAVTNPLNPKDVAAFVYTSPSSVQPFPQKQLKQSDVNDKGTPMVFDDTTGQYFPATNAATAAVIKPKARASGFTIGPNGQILPTGMMEPEATPSPTPEAAMTNSMAFQGVPASSDYTTNMPTLPAKTLSPGTMGDSGGISMAPAPSPTNAPTRAPALTTPDEIRAAYRQGAISKEQARALLQGGL